MKALKYSLSHIAQFRIMNHQWPLMNRQPMPDWSDWYLSVYGTHFILFLVVVFYHFDVKQIIVSNFNTLKIWKKILEHFGLDSTGVKPCSQVNGRVVVACQRLEHPGKNSVASNMCLHNCAFKFYVLCVFTNWNE